MVFTDNSPAQWLFARAAFEGWKPTPDELVDAVREEMPVALAMSASEREAADLSRLLSQGPSTQALGYRLHHIDSVAIRSRPVETLSGYELRQRAKRLVWPRNMFVLPKEVGALGSLDAFIEVMRLEGATCRGSIGGVPPARPEEQ